MIVFDSKRRYENLAIAVRVLQIWSFYYTHGQNHSSTRESFRWRSRWCHRRGLLKLPCDQSIAQRKKNKTKQNKTQKPLVCGSVATLKNHNHYFIFCQNMNCRYLQARMDARIVAVFLFLCLSTGYSLKNDNADDDILDMLHETDKLKEAPEMVSYNISLTFKCCFAFSAFFHPGHAQNQIICNINFCEL